jgi:hypothetical protein
VLTGPVSFGAEKAAAQRWYPNASLLLLLLLRVRLLVLLLLVRVLLRVRVLLLVLLLVAWDWHGHRVRLHRVSLLLGMLLGVAGVGLVDWHGLLRRVGGLLGVVDWRARGLVGVEGGGRGGRDAGHAVQTCGAVAVQAD